MFLLQTSKYDEGILKSETESAYSSVIVAFKYSERGYPRTTMSKNFAIIGGTGFEQLPAEFFGESLLVRTEMGEVSVFSMSDNYTEPNKTYFLSRHGAEHKTAPHEINYRANILALKQLEVGYIFATNAVGSLKTEWIPGTLVLFSDFLDFTRYRHQTLFSSTQAWSHTDMTVSYSPLLRSTLLHTAEAVGIPIQPSGVYLCTEGPRFETPAEIRMFQQWGAEIVGMTGVPEVVFAKEAGIEYAAIGLVTNLAAGIKDSPIDHSEHALISEQYIPLIRELLLHTCADLNTQIESA